MNVTSIVRGTTASPGFLGRQEAGLAGLVLAAVATVAVANSAPTAANGSPTGAHSAPGAEAQSAPAAASSRATGARSASAAANGSPTETWHFKVMLDGKSIGTHDFIVTRRPQDLTVETTAHFRVTALLVPLYHYDHHDVETWHGNCLNRIDARTNDNGRKLAVSGQLQDAGFAVQSSQASAALPACIKTFAYWDRAISRESRLLNAQTGEYTSVRLGDPGFERIHVGEHDVEAEHFSLVTAGFTVELWYSSSGEWLSLRSTTDKGKVLQYVRQ